MAARTVSAERPSFITTRMAVGLVLVSALSLLTFLVLSAYAPDLRNESSAGGNALSKSAIGYAGLRFLLEETNTDVFLRRDPQPCDYCSLVVLAPEIYSSAKEINDLAHPGPRLIVLPKWVVFPDSTHRGWVMRFSAFGIKELSNLLSQVAPGAKVQQRKATARVKLYAADARFADGVPAGAFSTDALQTVSGKTLETKIEDDKGNALLAQVKGTQIYVLAEPDLLNNHGLHDLAVARIATSMVQTIRVGRQPVWFDITLNGFRRAPDLLRTVFAPPFLGATLCAILAAAFIAFHAFSRFGAPYRPDRVYAFGKRALADNTAAVIHLMRREPRMAPRYAQTMLHLVAAQAGLTRERQSDTRWTTDLEQRRGMTDRFADLSAEADAVRDTHGLMRIAEKLYRWRRGILNERR